MPNTGANMQLVRRILGSMPNVKEGTIHGAPSFKLQGKMLACTAIHKSAEPNSLVIAVGRSARAGLIASDPALYIADHYEKYDVVLLRLARTTPESLRAMLMGAARFIGSGAAAQSSRAGARRAKMSNRIASSRRRRMAPSK